MRDSYLVENTAMGSNNGRLLRCCIALAEKATGKVQFREMTDTRRAMREEFALSVSNSRNYGR